MKTQIPTFKSMIRFASPALLGLSLAFVACNNNSATEPAATATPTIAIKSPTAGSAVSATNLMVKVMTSNFNYGKIGDANQDGYGHIHVYLDKPASSGTAYTAVIAGGDTVTIPGPISAGTHYIVVALQKNNHAPLNIQDSISFSVAGMAMPSLQIAEPAEGATVTNNVMFKLSVKNFKIVAPGTIKDGEGHVHYFVDGGTYNVLTDTMLTLTNLTPGAHKVRFTLQNNAHADLNIEKTVNFIVAASVSSVNAPSIAFASPMEGAMVGSSVNIKLSPTNFKVAAPGPVAIAGEGHFHYFVDGGTYNALADTMFTLNDLAIGAHSVKVTLQDDKHADLKIEKTLNFIVSATAPSFKIASPKPGDTLSGAITLTMSAKNFTVVAPGAVKANEGHFHYFIDGGTYNALADTTASLTALTPGVHKIRVTMQQGDHASLGLNSLHCNGIKFNFA